MIEFESVGKTFRDGTAAVVDLSLTVPTGKITVIVGPSGCGKTTTLRMVNRMLEPTSGRIVWDGSPLRSKRKTTLRRQMGYVIQSGGLFPHRTVLENIGTVPGLLGWSKDKTSKRSLELLGSVGLDRTLADRYPAQLSGGQQQRVGVARALAADPLVLLMDEPFSAVDPVVRSELHDFFLGLQREISKTIILITHDIDEAIKLGDQVAILRVGGRLAQVGTPQHLLEEPADAFVEGFVGKDRGFRSLSFMPADGLRLERVDVVREVEAAGSGAPTLVVDGDARPVGWAHRDQPGRVVPLGSTFVPEADTLRTALDSALTSPYGLAVAVAAGTGRFAGVVNAQQILDQVAEARAAAAESISVREVRPEPEPRPEAVEEPEDDTELRRPEPVEGLADDMRSKPDDGLRQEPADDMRLEPVEGPDEEMRLEPVEGSDDMRPKPVEGPDAEMRQEPVEGPPERTRSTGSTRIDELQLSAEPVEGQEGWAADSAPMIDEREPDRGHVR
ncbi:MAG TPA: ATP-binding cassette domain-containing protein [Propionibacteriaceae bacterium]|nr:ATP-binding cassette domain-containing protein [Propionibacteriaceae bacterium]